MLACSPADQVRTAFGDTLAGKSALRNTIEPLACCPPFSLLVCAHDQASNVMSMFERIRKPSIH